MPMSLQAMHPVLEKQ